MRALVNKLLADVRASYWFIPTCLVLAAAALAFVALKIDRSDLRLTELLPRTWTDTQLDDARAVLTVIAQSVIGVTGVMFSVTMVAVSFASGNFGPRLIGNFMRDRGNQWSLGILIATFVYTIFILRSLHGATGQDGADFVPHASIILAMALTLVSVFVMIFFVHHIPETINVSNISAGLGRRFRDALVATARAPEDEKGPELREGDIQARISLKQSGYIQRLEVDQLDKAAQENDLRLKVPCHPGKFVYPGQTVIESDRPLSDDLADDLRACFAIGPAKTENQHVLFIAEEQVEMIARALSPSVNDPYTAMNCLNWLAAGIAGGAARGVRFGIPSTPHVALPSVHLDELLGFTFGRAYPYVSGDRMALEHWRNLMDELATVHDGKLAEPVRKVQDAVDDKGDA